MHEVVTAVGGCGVSPVGCAQEHLAQLRVVGQLMGAAMRSSVLLALDLAQLFWRPLVGLSVSQSDLRDVDETAANFIRDLRAVRWACITACFGFLASCLCRARQQRSSNRLSGTQT